MTTGEAATLVQAAKGGNNFAFERLLEPVLQPGYQLACGMLHDPQAAEDAVQEAALKAWRKLGQLRDDSRLRPWFLGIVANECRSAQRSRWRSVMKADQSERVADTADSAISRIEVRRVLRGLDHKKRLVLVLHWYLDMTLEEISSVTGDSVHAVEGRLYRGMQELRRRLEAQRC